MSKISKYLVKSAVREDLKAFNAWEKWKISTEECIDKFKTNNRIKNRNFTEEEFKTWLNSLGYRR